MLAIGMITCQRRDIDVQNAIEQLRGSGFSELLHLFCEPGTPEIGLIADVVVHRNSTRRGVLGNWSYCLSWLLNHMGQ